MARLFYNLLILLLFPLVLGQFLFKCIKLKAYRARWWQRFSSGLSTPQPIDVWIHAVSLGESVAIGQDAQRGPIVIGDMQLVIGLDGTLYRINDLLKQD